MTNIPEEITISLPDLQRSALLRLMGHVAPGYGLADLLELIVVKGINALLIGRDLPTATEPLCEKALAFSPSDPTGAPGRRETAEFLGFGIDAHRDRALDELMDQHPHVDEEELCRVVLGCGLRTVHDDPIARAALEAAEERADRGGER